jgi:hypothetical protein
MVDEKLDLQTAEAISSLIGEQTDLLWTVAIGLIVAEVFIGCRYFVDREGKFRWLWTPILWVGSIVCHLASLLFGYSTKGALITMTLKAGTGAKTAGLFSTAELMALLQAGSLFVGLVLAALAFGFDAKRMAKAVRDAK